MNKSLFILLSTLTMCANSAQKKDELHYEPIRPAVFAATRLGQVGIAHNGKDFAVIKDGKTHPVKSYLVDKTLRGKSTQQIAKYLAHHAIEIKEGNDHEFSLEAHNRQLGGGAGGVYWGAAIGKWGTTFVGHALITGGCRISDFFVPGSGLAAEPAIRIWATPLIEAASIKMAIAGGIIGGAATGPV